MPKIIRTPVLKYRPKIIADDMGLSVNKHFASFHYLDKNKGYHWTVELTEKDLVNALESLQQMILEEKDQD